ncbi:uncharacterized protein LOC144133731 isoform X1 [Amblyomma americanum]
METPCVAPPTSRTLHTLAEDGSFRGASRIRTQETPYFKLRMTCLVILSPTTLKLSWQLTSPRHLTEFDTMPSYGNCRLYSCPADPPPRGQHAISSWEDWEVLLMSADPTSQLAAVTRAADVISRHDLLDAVRDRAVAQGPSWV